MIGHLFLPINEMSSAKEEFGIKLLLGNIPTSSNHFINFYFSGSRQRRAAMK